MKQVDKETFFHYLSLPTIFYGVLMEINPHNIRIKKAKELLKNIENDAVEFIWEKRIKRKNYENIKI